MPFRSLNQCCDCDEIVDSIFDHDCPNDPMNDPAEKAKAEAWRAEFDRKAKVWTDWQNETGELKHAYPSIDYGPTDVAHEGFCVLVQDADEFCDDNDEQCGPFVSATVLNNPTWGEVAREFDKAIVCTGDYHHSFLEGLCKANPKYMSDGLKRGIGSISDDVTILRFSTGS